MNHFSIRDIENLCGIRAHTLRIWEQRYKLCVAKRKDSRHRIYDNDDLKELLRISFLYHHGYKISRIAALDAAAIKDAIIAVGAQHNPHEYYIHQLLEASLDFDKERFDDISRQVEAQSGLEKAVFNVFYPFLQRIGLLWMTNHVIPAQEHFSSHIIRKKIICAIDNLEPAYLPGLRVLLFAPEGEQHEIPLLAADYLLKKNKIRTVYFGANTSMEAMELYLRHRQADLIYTHVISCPEDSCIDHYLSCLANKFRGKKILVAGQATRMVQRKPESVTILGEPHELIDAVQKIAAQVRTT
jgi:MerR family transcriptional regulator, light-induced transcriptional regulator